MVPNSKNTLSNETKKAMCEIGVKPLMAWDHWKEGISRSLPYEINIMIFFNTGLIFTKKVFILRKEVWGPRDGRREF